MRILLLGASGFLGANLAFAAEAAGHSVEGVVRKPVSFLNKSHLVPDISNIEDLIRSDSFDAVINCVAIASHEQCEKNPEQARQINSVYPELWSESAGSVGSGFVQISTDAVFDGLTDKLYKETDKPNPTSTYGKTKLAGERAALSVNKESLVIRTNFFGWSPGGSAGVLDFFYSSFRGGTEITGFSDYVVSSLYIGHLVDLLLALIQSGASGIIHAVSSTPMTKYDFGIAVAEAAGLSTNRMREGKVEEIDHLVPRGWNLGLNTDRIQKILGAQIPSTVAGIEKAFAEREQLLSYFGRR